MKKIIASLALATALSNAGCAHHTTKPKAAETAATLAVIAGLVLLASFASCGDCNIGTTGIDDPHVAHPPR
jgi:hypothetical protein